MDIVFVSAEVAPWSKTGGLGDVVGSLPIALAARGHRVMVVAPRWGAPVSLLGNCTCPHCGSWLEFQALRICKRFTRKAEANVWWSTTHLVSALLWCGLSSI